MRRATPPVSHHKRYAPLVIASCVSFVAGCGPEQDETPDCTVTSATRAQAAAIYGDAYVAYVLDEAIGGQVCVPGLADACDEQPRCSGALDVVVGETATFTIGIENRSTRGLLSVDAVVLGESDPAWTIDEAAIDGGSFAIDPETTVPVRLRVSPQVEGVITAQLLVSSDASNVTQPSSSSVAVFLSATGVQP